MQSSVTQPERLASRSEARQDGEVQKPSSLVDAVKGAERGGTAANPAGAWCLDLFGSHLHGETGKKKPQTNNKNHFA